MKFLIFILSFIFVPFIYGQQIGNTQEQIRNQMEKNEYILISVDSLNFCDMFAKNDETIIYWYDSEKNNICYQICISNSDLLIYNVLMNYIDNNCEKTKDGFYKDKTTNNICWYSEPDNNSFWIFYWVNIKYFKK